MTAREVALQKRIDEIAGAISDCTEGAWALIEMSDASKPLNNGANADAFRSAVNWVANRLHDEAEKMLALTDYAANPLDDGEEASA